MAIEAFTAVTLAEWMERRLGPLAGILEWTAEAGDFDDVVKDAMLSLGTDDLTTKSTLAQIKEVQTFARVALWAAVVEATAGHYAFTADGGTFNRQQIQEMAQGNLDRAMADSMAYTDAYTIGTAPITYHNDFYRDHDDGLFD